MRKFAGTASTSSSLKRGLWFFILLLFSFSCLWAQEAYSIDQIMKILIDSPILYEMAVYDTVKVTPPERTLRYNPIFYQEVKGNEITVLNEVMDERTQSLYDQAEEFFSAGDFYSAVLLYNEIHKEHPELSLVTAYLGQSLRLMEEYDAAKSFFIEAVKTNFHNYMAHWFLANIYFWEGKTKPAVHHITLAKILCRNNPTIDESFQEIMRKAKRNPDDCYFEPQVRVYQAGSDTIRIEAAQVEWMFYGQVKAMWKYEPGYHDDMKGGEPGDFNLSEAAEAYIALGSIYDKKKPEERNIPILNYLYQSYKKKMARAFVLYEMLLPDNPVAAVMLPKKDIMDIQTYLLKVKHSK